MGSNLEGYSRSGTMFAARATPKKPANALERMARMAVAITKSANGQSLERFVKRRELRLLSAAATQDYITKLLGARDYCCDLTGLPSELDEVNADPKMFASLDRIDSSGL